MKPIKDVACLIADEMASHFYYKIVMLKFIPEIKEMESGAKLALKGAEIDRFLDSLAK